MRQETAFSKKSWVSSGKEIIAADVKVLALVEESV